MNRIIFLFILALTFTGCASEPEKPNVILIMADDLGWGDTGYNGNEVIMTPFLDQMSEEGLRFDRFYSGSAVCSPTRASVLTGRNPFRTGVFTANNGILRPEEITIPEALKKHGYVCGHFGKWHLGTLTHEIKDANRGAPGNTEEFNPPSQHGFDVNFSTESKVPTWDPMRKTRQANKDGWQSITEGEEYEHYGTHYWDTDGNMVTENLEGDDSRVIMDRVLPFIDQSAEDGNPFLAVVWFHTPHKPCVAGPAYREMYKEHDLKMQNYAGCITAMDEQIGRLRNFLSDKGIEKNTMIWFCSDNGPENGNPGSTGGLRDRKRSLHEGGIRVPGILVWPAKVKQGRTTSTPCFTSDYLPTIIGAVGESVQDWPNELDGTDIGALINGGELEREKPLAFMHGGQVVLMEEDLKIYYSDALPELYNITEDRSEKKDLGSEKPETVTAMTDQLKMWQESCRNSFNGDEYGTESYDRMGQRWRAPKIEK
ncbi:sulfatase [Bacteroidota bacterium]